MPVAGQPDVATLSVPGGGAGTVAALTLTSPLRVSTALVGEATADGGATWTCPIPGSAYTAPGVWYQRWTVTGAGAGAYVVQVDVTPPSYVAVAPWAYATTTDLANYLHATCAHADPLPDGAEGKLHRASQRIDRILKSAVYDVDEDDMPTNAKVIEAMRDATCEIVAWWMDTGDESGAMASFVGAATAGRISFSRGAQAAKQAQTAGGYWVSSQALVLLDGAGLLGHAPYIY